jgi:predicted ATP-grasp superfamily ATP-dependent carboligase
MPSGSLLREGWAMLAALAEDMAAVNGVEVSVMADGRQGWHARIASGWHAMDTDAKGGAPPIARPSHPCSGRATPIARLFIVSEAEQERQTFRRLAAESDWTVVIAPEFGGILLERCRTVEAVGGRLLGSPATLVELAADKHATAEHLRSAGVPVPQGVSLRKDEFLPRDFGYPAVLKPRDGAGSQGVRLIRSPHEVGQAPWPARLEEYCPGQAASVAVLAGPDGRLVLEPCRQHLANGCFSYLGGSLPLSAAQSHRARGLAEQVVAALPPFLGYLGIDLVIGASVGGEFDRVIEVNPRLTTSYVGLRAAARQNLAAVMLELAQGGRPELTYRRDLLAAGITFDSAGEVSVAHELAGA